METRRTKVAGLVAVSGCLMAAAVPSPSHANTTSPFDVAVQGRLHATLVGAVTRLGIPGAVAGVWVQGQGWEDAVGTRDIATGAPLRLGDRVRVGSVTKTFTATLVLQLVGRGLIALDDPVSRYVAGVPNGDAITIRQLLEMRSGLFDYTNDLPSLFRYLAYPYQAYTPDQLLAVAFSHPPVFAPGSAVGYSNTNYVLLGRVVESVTGQPFASVLQDAILTPLGLRHTGIANTPAPLAAFAHGYTDGLAGTLTDTSRWNVSWASTAGAMYSTLDDMHRWAEELAQGSLLVPQLQALRLAPTGTSYGLGVMQTNGWVGHDGEVPGYNSAVYVSPDADAIVVVVLDRDVLSWPLTTAHGVASALASVVLSGRAP